MNNKTVLIIGATSSLARAIAVQFAKEKTNLILGARNVDEAERIAADLKIKFGCETQACKFDAEAYEHHKQFCDNAIEQFGSIDGIIVSIGNLGDQHLAQVDFSEAMKIISANYLGAISVLTHIANYFEQRKEGFIIAIGSVAGDRGRQSNYVYGSAKAAFAAFVSGLRNRLSRSAVQVLLVKPGFMDTKMTFGKIKKSLLVASPEQIAGDIYAALKAGKSTVYVPWFWQLIMFVIRLIPESIFMRMKL